MDIKEGYDRFELTHRPPSWDVCDKKYVFDLTTGGTPLDATAACPARQGDTLLAALQTKEQADDAQFKVEVAAIADRNAKQTEAEQQAEAEKAAAKNRGQAIGGFFSGVFGGGSAGANAPGQSGDAVVAPTPMPSPKGA
jgi:membrane protein involved in colicin uptake